MSDDFCNQVLLLKNFTGILNTSMEVQCHYITLPTLPKKTESSLYVYYSRYSHGL